jgi:hypothetical protein
MIREKTSILLSVFVNRKKEKKKKKTGRTTELG